MLGASDGKLTNFLPAQGMVSTDSLYPAQKDAISPRLGVTWVPSDSRKTVIRGGYGLFYDMFAVAFFTANTGFANGGALGVGNNPGGDQPVFSITQRRQTVVNNVPIFGTTPQPPYGAFAVSQDLKLPYVENFNVNVEQQLGPTTIAQIGYVGTRGHRLALMRDINAATPGAALAQARRPYATRYPDLAAINELESIGRSTYNSLQMSLIQSAWHGLSGRLNYTLSHAMDNGSEARNTLPMIQDNIDADWGNAAFDIRHVFTAGFTYNLPGARPRPAAATAGRSTRSRRSRAARRSRSRPAPTPAAPASARIGPTWSAIPTPTSSSRTGDDAAVAAVVQPGGVRRAGGRHVRQPRTQRALRPWVQERRPVGVQDDQVDRQRLGAAAARGVQPVQHHQLGEPRRGARHARRPSA